MKSEYNPFRIKFPGKYFLNWRNFLPKEKKNLQQK
jgi:hypothetical protein